METDCWQNENWYKYVYQPISTNIHTNIINKWTEVVVQSDNRHATHAHESTRKPKSNSRTKSRFVYWKRNVKTEKKNTRKCMYVELYAATMSVELKFIFGWLAKSLSFASSIVDWWVTLTFNKTAQANEYLIKSKSCIGQSVVMWEKLIKVCQFGNLLLQFLLLDCFTTIRLSYCRSPTSSLSFTLINFYFLSLLFLHGLEAAFLNL